MVYLLMRVPFRRAARLDRHVDQLGRLRGFAVFRATLTVGGTNIGKVLQGASWAHPIYASSRTTTKKSVFLAHASTLPSRAALEPFLAHLTALPALKRATHCMYAYRIVPDATHTMSQNSKESEYVENTIITGQHDGGEKGSGERLARLLEALECRNVVVVVSRWYGGVKLGSDRWKMISSVAKEALRTGGLGKEKAGGTVLPDKRDVKRKQTKR